MDKTSRVEHLECVDDRARTLDVDLESLREPGTDEPADPQPEVLDVGVGAE